MILRFIRLSVLVLVCTAILSDGYVYAVIPRLSGCATWSYRGEIVVDGNGITCTPVTLGITRIKPTGQKYTFADVIVTEEYQNEISSLTISLKGAKLRFK